jgi:membrane associated rhomboid family serine protease
MGAYLLLHPRSSILTLIGWLILPVPAFILLVVWMGFQVFSALGDGGAGASVAWWAHIGGFLLGMALTPFFKRDTAPYGGITGIKKGIRMKRPPRGSDDPPKGPWS